MAQSSFEKLINGEKPVLIDFHAEWCGPCKMMNPIVKNVAKSQSDKLRVIKVDIDKNQTLSQKLNIKGVPTFMLYEKGELLWQKSGGMSEHELITALDAMLG